MSDELELKSLCLLWQKRLRLQDWRIDVRLVDSGELEEAQGAQNFVHSNNRSAVIKIRRHDSYDKSSDYYKAFPDMFDLERTLLHELVHIPLDGIIKTEDDVDEFEHRAQEQAIEMLTDALYEAYSAER